MFTRFTIVITAAALALSLTSCCCL